MSEIVASPYFGIALSILAFEIGVWINKKTKSSIANPLLIAIIIVIGVLKIFNIPLESYNEGGEIITIFLAPATASLAISIYSQLPILKKNLLPIIAGTAVGSAVSMTSVFVLCKAFHLDEKLVVSMLPKSVTTPIAMEISTQLGGIVPVTVAAVVVTGILGAVLTPMLIKLFKIDNAVAVGLAIGTSSHAVGTSKALEIGEIEGAMSGIAIGVSGIITVIYALFLG